MHNQEEKQVVEGDYIDKDTGLRFIEDIRGNIHFCAMLSGNHMPEPNVTNNYNTTNNYTVDNPYINAHTVILQSTIEGFTWTNTTAFNRINNSYGSGYVGYTTPIDKKLHITSLFFSQSKTGAGLDTSLLGLFVQGNLVMSFPLLNYLNHNFFQPYVVDHSTYIEFKYKPSDKKLNLSILILGYLI